MKKVAILGGGMSALVTAMRLVDADPERDKLDITVYQHGWRLGGKGASGRNADEHQRIEEHGLHLMFGFYENVFQVMRRAYTDETGDPDEWKKHFTAETVDVAMMERTGGKWQPWPVPFPSGDPKHQPGDGQEFATHPWFFVDTLIDWLHQLRPASVQKTTQGLVDTFLPDDDDKQRERIHQLAGANGWLSELWSRVTSAFAVHHLLPPLLRRLTDVVPGDPIAEDYRGAEADRASVRKLTRAFADATWAATEEHRLAILVDFAAAVIIGLVCDRPRTWFELDQWDLRDWLARHGARPETVNSPPVAAFYDAIFSSYATVGAGTILQAMLRASFTFKGSVVWKMRGGMGDVIFAPLYRYLKKRKVKFRFFHKVDRLHLSDDKRCVQRISIDRQVDLIDRHGEYQPLTKDGYWPNQPDWTQIDPAQVEQLKQQAIDLESGFTTWKGTPTTLERGADFDEVVLGISIGALPHICEELVDDRYNTAFREMLLGVQTTATEAAQLWLKNGPRGPASVVIPYVDPYDTVADMSHLLPYEKWGPGEVDRIKYLCSALQEEDDPPGPGDTGYPARLQAQATKDLRAWLDGPAKSLWPEKANVVSQYVNTPNHLSDRYVLATAGSNSFRLCANQSGYENLYLTGDWIKNALSVGCLESATMGGIQAARALVAGTAELLPLLDKVPPAANDWLGDPRPRVVSRARVDSPYIERDGDMLARPPIELKMRLFLFLLEASTDRLARVCHLHLNQLKPPGSYLPFGPMVVFYCAEMDNIVAPLGDCRERDFGFWVPVVHQLGDVHRLLTFTPYIWVDNGIALVGGRSLFGFPKQIGRLALPREPGDRFEFTVDTMVLPQTGGAAVEKRLVHVARSDGKPFETPSLSWQAIPGMLEAFMQRVMFHGGLKNVSWQMVRDWVTKDRGIRGVFLKQLANAETDDGACYQEIVEAPISVNGMPRGGALPGPFEVQIRSYSSHRIVENLGLVAKTDGDGVTRLQPIAQGWMEFDAVVKPGEVVKRRFSIG